MSNSCLVLSLVIILAAITASGIISIELFLAIVGSIWVYVGLGRIIKNYKNKKNEVI